jgi:hypothetical protein
VRGVGYWYFFFANEDNTIGPSYGDGGQSTGLNCFEGIFDLNGGMEYLVEFPFGAEDGDEIFVALATSTHF